MIKCTSAYFKTHFGNNKVVKICTKIMYYNLSSFNIVYSGILYSIAVEKLMVIDYKVKLILAQIIIILLTLAVADNIHIHLSAHTHI